MIVSDVVKTDVRFRLWRKATSVLNTLSRRLEWHRKYSPLMPMHIRRYHSVCGQIRNEQSRLDSNEFNSHTPLEWLKKPVEEITDHVFVGLRAPSAAQHSAFERSLAEVMTLKGHRQRAASHKFHICCEVARRAKQGWFMIFNTLTVEPWQYAKIFSKDSKAFQTYIRKFDRLVATAVFGRARLRKGEIRPTYHTYFAVVEEGTRTGRLHLHVLHFCAQLPAGSRDPNTGLARPKNREIAALKKLWPHGWSTPIAVRTSPRDPYGRKGWRWPLDRKTGQGLKAKSPLAVAGYVSKYVLKSYLAEKRSKLLWRTRKTQKLGTAILSELVSRLKSPTLLAIASQRLLSGRLNNSKIPPELLRLAAIREWRDRHGSKNLFALATQLSPLPSLLQSWRDTMTRKQLPNRGSSGLTEIDGTIDAATFKAAQRDLNTACEQLDRHYFPRTVSPYTHQSIRDFVG